MWRNDRFKVTLAELFAALKHLKFPVTHEAQHASNRGDLSGYSFGRAGFGSGVSVARVLIDANLNDVIVKVRMLPGTGNA